MVTQLQLNVVSSIDNISASSIVLFIDLLLIEGTMWPVFWKRLLSPFSGWRSEVVGGVSGDLQTMSAWCHHAKAGCLSYDFHCSYYCQ